MSYPQKTLHILVIEFSQNRQTIELNEQTYSLGRQINNKIVIDSKNISRQHATLIQKKEQKNSLISYWILDGNLQGIKSHNGILVNGQRCYTKELKDGDIINFGCEVNAVYHAINLSSNMLSIEDFSSPKLGVYGADLKAINKRTTLLLSQHHYRLDEQEPTEPKLEKFSSALTGSGNPFPTEQNLNNSKPQKNDQELVENFDVLIKNSKLSKAETALKQALEENQFSLYYQPQYNIRTKEINCLEALLRWEHPKKGLILPNRFISFAEQTGLIIPIGQWVLETACQQTQIWQQQLGLPPLCISVNISPQQFGDPGFRKLITQVLEKTGIIPNFLELEITEKSLMDHEKFAEKIFQDLQNLGVHFSMDDFGAGYASLSFLNKFPFHTLKIAQSFMKNFANKPQDFALLSAVLAWGNITKLNIVAEGVETEEQLELLRRLNVEKVQGYQICAPLTVQEANKFLLLHFSEAA